MLVFRRVQEGVEGESSQIFVSFMWTWDQSWSGPLSSIVFNWCLYHHDILVLHHVPFAKCNRWLFDHAGSAWMLVCQRDCCQSLQPGNRQRRSVPWIEEWPCATCGSMFAKLGFKRTSLKYLCCSRPFWKLTCSFFAGGFPKLFFEGKPAQKTAKAGCYRFHQEVILRNFEGAINHKRVPLIKPSDPWSISTVNLPQTHSVHLCHRWMSSSKFPRCRACAEVTISILICTKGPTLSLLAFFERMLAKPPPYNKCEWKSCRSTFYALLASASFGVGEPYDWCFLASRLLLECSYPARSFSPFQSYLD